MIVIMITIITKSIITIKTIIIDDERNNDYDNNSSYNIDGD